MGIRDSLCSLCLCARKNWKTNNQCHLRRRYYWCFRLGAAFIRTLDFQQNRRIIRAISSRKHHYYPSSLKIVDTKNVEAIEKSGFYADQSTN